MSQNKSFNELTTTSHAVWCDLAPGVDPASWAWLCRRLGKLTAEDFRELRKETKPQSLVKTLLKSWRTSNPAPKTSSPDVPLVSVGPSGLGGVYQNEVRVKARQVSALRVPRTSRIDLRA